MIHRLLLAMLSVLAGLCSSVLIVIGILNRWPRHVVFGGIVLVAWFAIVILESRLPSRLDLKTGRLYYKADKYSNPSKAWCPSCHAFSYFIYTPRRNGRRYYGVDCRLHGLVWFDKVKVENAD